MTKQEDPLDESMTVAKTGTCDTITKKSKLTYQIGTLPDGEVYLRIHKNSGNGFFSREWVSGFTPFPRTVELRVIHSV